MLDVLYNDIKNLGRTEGRKKERTNEITNEQKKSHIEVAAPPKKVSKHVKTCQKSVKTCHIG